MSDQITATAKDSVAGKRQRAYWDDKLRAGILFD